MLLGCTGQPSGETSGAASGEPPPGDPASPDAVGDGQVAEPPAITLERGLGHEATITEVWLDPRASAALTLDAMGGVRLWPALPPAQTKLEALTPIRVPIREPLWLSFARAGETSFVVAAIDTAQAARVLEIQLDEAGTASFRERFRTTPRDPLLELHVLDGGERLLALGVDHRIRLYDGRGKLLSELTEYGLVPWQLRVSSSLPGGPPDSLQLAMVLAGPTRLQRFAIHDDRLAKHGEPRAFTLDRGPNGNDLALLPSGRVAAVLRRPKAKGPQWSLELHDLDTGEVRVMWGEVQATTRPRLLIVDDQQALLEDGISGYWLDLSKAVVMPAPFELPKELESLPPETHVVITPVPLPGTTERTRRHTSVVAGIRVAPVERMLLLDPLSTNPPAEGERHHKLGHRAVSISGLDFESTGELLAIQTGKEILVESTSTGTPQPGGCAAENVFRFKFIDPEHILLIGRKQATICAWRTGQMVATLDLPAPPELPDLVDIEDAAIHATGPGTGEIGLRRSEWNDGDTKLHLTHTSYANEAFGAIEPLAKADFDRWPELGDKWHVAVIDAAGNRYLATDENTRKFAITLASGERRDIQLVEAGADEIDIEQLEPSPDGRFVAIVTVRGSEDYGHGYYGGYGGYAYSNPETLSVWALGSEPPELRWTTITGSGHVDLAWTDDGSRLAIEDEGRLRVITNDGKVLLDRGNRDFQLEALDDVPADPSTTPKPP
jgi:hypothetical protein